MRYAALDFEAGNGNPISACSLGLSVFEDYELIRQEGFLIHPPRAAGKFHWGNVRIHGLRRQDLIGMPAFDELWPRLQPDLEGSVIVCHNAAFDTAVLCACLEYYRLPLPDCQYICTVKVSQAVWPDMENHRLNTVAQALGISLEHHKAGSDAYACGRILLEALRATGCADAEELAGKLGMRLGVLGGPPCLTAQELQNASRSRPERHRSPRSPVSRKSPYPSVFKPTGKGENHHERVFNRPAKH